MQIKSSRALLNFGKFAENGVNGQLTLTPEDLRFVPNSKRFPDLVIPLDAIKDFGSVEDKGMVRRLMVTRIAIEGCMRPIFFELNTGENLAFVVPHPREWRDAVVDASLRFAESFFLPLTERTKQLIAKKQFSEAKAMLRDVLGKLSHPAYMAHTYSCLSTVHWANRDKEKAHEAYTRAKALLNQCDQDSELTKTVNQIVNSQFNKDVAAVIKQNVMERFQISLDSESTHKEDASRVAQVNITPSSVTSSVEDRLTELERLKQKKIITEDEYRQRREQILDDI
jgi:hypothetical protein